MTAAGAMVSGSEAYVVNAGYRGGVGFFPNAGAPEGSSSLFGVGRTMESGRGTGSDFSAGIRRAIEIPAS